MSKVQEEILAQFDALNQTLETMQEARRWCETLHGRRVFFTGCGSSYMLCESAAMMLRTRGLDAFAIPAGDLITQPKEYARLLRGAALIIPSRSGKTSECLRAVEIARKTETPVLALTADGASPLATAADAAIALPFAFDEAVCQTRNVSCFYTALAYLSGLLSGDRDLLEGLQNTVEELPALFAATQDHLLKAAWLKKWRSIYVLCDGPLAALGKEAALAFSEIAMLPGSHWHMLDVRHGPMVLVGEDTLVLAATPWEENPYLESLMEDFNKRGATVVLVAPYAQPPVGEMLRVPIFGGRDMICAGLPMILSAQWLALQAALARGHDPDRPEGLTSWIEL
ncbi:MAG: SIS domain-containing protein [Clostridia bacterium]|nr:SIS domain-containing protein [Clostridia bacterium]